ncbi:MAG: hypothetical protein ACK5MK_07920 [Dysgonomonas sp.]
MSKIYNIPTSPEKTITNCSFEITKIENKEVKETSVATYSEILKIFKEAFSLIDITKIIKGLK